MVLCLKKIEIFEIQNFNKIPSFTIFFFYLFSIFGIFFLFHPSKLVKKIMLLFVVFYWKH